MKSYYKHILMKHYQAARICLELGSNPNNMMKEASIIYKLEDVEKN